MEKKPKKPAKKEENGTLDGIDSEHVEMDEGQTILPVNPSADDIVTVVSSQKQVAAVEKPSGETFFKFEGAPEEKDSSAGKTPESSGGTLMNFSGAGKAGTKVPSTDSDEEKTVDGIKTVYAEAAKEIRPKLGQEKTSVKIRGQRYKLDKEIGRGGMGVIKRIVNADFKRFEVVKDSLLANSEEALEMFEREAMITGMLEHPNIPVVHEFYYDEQGKPCYRMQLIVGEDMHKIINKRENSWRLDDEIKAKEKNLEELVQGNKAEKLRKDSEEELTGLKEKKKVGLAYLEKYSEKKLIKYFAQACRGLAYAHSRGIIHRDLKPQNIMIGTQKDKDNAVLIDWGLAKEKSEKETIADKDLQEKLKEFGDVKGSQLSYDGQIKGTPAYMSPEQAEGSLNIVDELSDIFSMGAVLYEIMTGEPPYAGSTPINIIAEAVNLEKPVQKPSERYLAKKNNKELEVICMKALAKKREGRYQSMKEMIDDVEAYLENRPVSAYSYSLLQRCGKWLNNHPRFKIALEVGLVVLIGGGSLAGYFIVNAEKKARVNAEKAQKETEGREAAERKGKEDAIKRLTAIEDMIDASETGDYAKDEETSIKILSEIIKNNPEIANLFNNRGCSYLELDRFEEALADFEEAIRIDPKRAALPWYNKGRLYLQQDKSDEAIFAFKESAAIKPKYVKTYNKLVEIYKKKENWTKLLENARICAELAPKDSVNWANLGYAFKKNSLFLEAEEPYEKAFAMGDKDVAGSLVEVYTKNQRFYKLGLKYFEYNNYTKAVPALEQAIQTNDHPTEAQELLEKIKAAQKK